MVDQDGSNVANLDRLSAQTGRIRFVHAEPDIDWYRTSIRELLGWNSDLFVARKHLKKWAASLADDLATDLSSSYDLLSHVLSVRQSDPAERKSLSKLCVALNGVQSEFSRLLKDEKYVLLEAIVNLFKNLNPTFIKSHGLEDEDPLEAFYFFYNMSYLLGGAVKSFVVPVDDGKPFSEFRSGPVGKPPDHESYEAVGRKLVGHIMMALDSQDEILAPKDIVKLTADLLKLIEKRSPSPCTKKFFPASKAQKVAQRCFDSVNQTGMSRKKSSKKYSRNHSKKIRKRLED